MRVVDIGMGFGLLGIVGLFLWIAFIVLVFTLLVLAVRWLLRADRESRYGPPPPPPPGPDPLAILRERYARGEIDDEEYERRRRLLGG
jgi:putative membrane protein